MSTKLRIERNKAYGNGSITSKIFRTDSEKDKR